MNNNFKVKKTSLKQKIDFSKSTNELDNVFGIKKVKLLEDYDMQNLKDYDMQNVIDALSKKSSIAEMIGLEENYYIVISKDYNNMVGTKSDIEKMFLEYNIKPEDVNKGWGNLILYELKSPKPISFSIETKISLKINK